MPATRPVEFLVILGLSLILCSCFHPPYNNFRTDHRTARTVAKGAVIGASAGLVSSYLVPGLAIGTAAGTAIGVYKDSKQGLINELNHEKIAYVEYGSTITLIIPTDIYYEFDEPLLNDLQFKGLNAMIKLLKYYPKSPIYIAAFSDNIGTRNHKRRLTQGRAESMLGFLWSHGFKSAQLLSQGYGDDHPVGDNFLIHGSAFNRRIEIQFFKDRFASSPQVLPVFSSK